MDNLVQEENFQNIFDLSFDNGLINGGKADNSFDNVISHNDRKNRGIIGVRSSNHQIIDNDNSRDTLSPSLLTSLLLSAVPSSPLNLSQTNKNNDPWGNTSLSASKVDDSDIEQLQKLRSSAFPSTNFSQSQLDQLKQLQQQLTLSEKQQLAATLFSGSNDIPTQSDLAYRQEQQPKFNNHSNHSSFNFDNHDDKSSSSASSSSSSSSDSFASSGTNAKVNTSRYKTEMCRPFQENGSCKYGEKCQFAHGLSELRTV